jgi:hypothetical protein
MYHQVQQFREDEHAKKIEETRVRDQIRYDLQAQIEENRRVKAEKTRNEKQNEAALQKEYDRMMAERELIRVSLT